MLNNWLFFTICLVLVLGQLLRFEPLPNIALYPHDLLIGVFLLVNSKIFIKKSVSKWRTRAFYNRHRQLIWLIGWLGLTGVLKLLISGQPTYLLYLARYFFYGTFLYLFSLFIQLKPIKFKVTRIRPTVVLFAQHLPLFFGLVALAMFVIQPDMRFFRSLGWDDHYYRLTGTLLDPNYTGIILAIGALITIKTTFFPSLTMTKHKLLQFFESTALLITLTLTYSRSSWLAFTFGLIIFLIAMKKGWDLNLPKVALIFTLIVTIMFSTFALAPKPGGEGVNLKRVYSLESRQLFDQQWLNSESVRPLNLVLGPSQAPKSNTHARLPNNLFITIFAWSGPIGVLLFLGVLIELVYKNRRLPIFLGTLVALLVFAQFNSITEPFVILIIGTLLVIEKNFSPAVTA